MGTTVTPNLALIKPDIDEQIQSGGGFDGWATQNGFNSNAIDDLFRHSNSTWTPSWTADTTNPTLGAGGFVEGKHLRMFPRMVIGYLRIFTGGAGFAAGSGLYSVTPPHNVAADLANLHNFLPVGRGYLHDNDTVATSSICVVMYELATNLLTFKKHDGDSWRNNTPFTLAQNDRLSAYFMYPTGAA